METLWNPTMSVNDKTIDNQHKKILTELEKLQKELSNGVDMSVIRQTINFFGRYAEEHLIYEEVYMKGHKFPKLTKHLEKHNLFRKYFEDFKTKFKEAYVMPDFSSSTIQKLLQEAYNFLSKWWINHILQEDHKYAVYIAEH